MAGSIFLSPLYFQAIDGVSPMLGSVYLLPSILPQLVMAASSGAISKSDTRAFNLGGHSATC